MLPRTLYATLVLLLAVLQSPPIHGDVVIEVSAGKHDRVGTPMSLRLSESLKQHVHFTLTRLDTDKRVAVQVSAGEKPHLVWLLQNPLAAGTIRRYRLSPSTKPPASKDGVAVEIDDKHLKVTSGGKPVLAYNTAVVPSPNRQESYYDRSGYIHPLYNPRGQVITDDFAPDHPHQHGIMFPWTNTTFEGRAVNFWDQKDGNGRIEHAKVESSESGPVFGGFTVRLKHLDVTIVEAPKPVLTETWRVRVYNLSNHFLFDLESAQRSLGSPLHIKKYHYGGLAIRGHRDWLVPGQGNFLTSENKNRNNGNQTRPRWCDIHGTVDGQMTGVTILCDPSNFRSPQPVRLHPEKPYFCFAPMALGDFKIEVDKTYVSRYRFYVHNGQLDTQAADRFWQDLADPPRIKLSGDASSEKQ